MHRGMKLPSEAEAEFGMPGPSRRIRRRIPSTESTDVALKGVSPRPAHEQLLLLEGRDIKGHV